MMSCYLYYFCFVKLAFESKKKLKVSHIIWKNLLSKADFVIVSSLYLL